MVVCDDGESDCDNDAGDTDDGGTGAPGRRLPRILPAPASAVTPGPMTLTVSPELELTTTVAGGA